MKYNVNTKSEGVLQIDAKRFERNGNGTVFYDENDNQLAVFGDGEVKSVRPASLTTAPEAADPAGDVPGETA